MARNGSEGHTSRIECGFEMSEIRALISENSSQVKSLIAEIKALSDLQRNMNRYLLVVVCVIALGKSAIDAVKSVWGHEVQSIISQK